MLVSWSICNYCQRELVANTGFVTPCWHKVCLGVFPLNTIIVALKQTEVHFFRACLLRLRMDMSRKIAPFLRTSQDVISPHLGEKLGYRLWHTRH